MRHLTKPAATTTLVVGLLLAASVGTAGAAALITGQQIKDGSVAGRDVANSSLTGRDVRNGSLTSADIAGSVGGATGSAGPVGPEGPKGATGPAGPAGPQGIAGPTGPSGANGVSGLGYDNLQKTVGPGAHVLWEISCPLGKRALAGGVATDGNPHYARITTSAPADNGTGWWVGVKNMGDTSLSEYAWVVCATAP